MKNKRVILFDTDVISRGGPRIVDALEKVAEALHSELSDESFGDVSEPQESPPGAVVVIAVFVSILKRGSSTFLPDDSGHCHPPLGAVE